MVVIDDMHLTPMGRFGRMKMCHMLADTDEELLVMAERIGVARRWHQYPGQHPRSHFDIAMSKRALAVAAGAVEITMRQTGHITMRRRLEHANSLPRMTIAQILEAAGVPAQPRSEE